VRVGRRALDDREQRRAGAVGDAVDDRAARLVAEARREQARAGRRWCAGRGERIEALLQAAEVVRAGDDLLAGVTALAEADGVERVEIERLRHGLVGGAG